MKNLLDIQGSASRLFLAVTVLVGSISCAPETRYRRTALVPAARAYPWNGRTAKAGSLRIEGALSYVNVDPNLFPQVGDTAVNVPRTTIDGAAALAVSGGFEVGLRYSYAAYEWRQRSAAGTMSIPSHSPVTGLGPEIRGTIWLDDEKRWALGIGGNLLVYSIPVALWERNDTCTPSSTCEISEGSFLTGRYELVEEDKESEDVYNVGVYPSVAFGSTGQYGHAFGGLSLHTAFKNDGFSETDDGPMLEGAGYVWLVGAGYGITVDAFRAAAMMSLPMSDDPVDYAPPTFFVTIGADLPLWRSEPKEPPRPLPAAPPPYYAPPQQPGYPPPQQPAAPPAQQQPAAPPPQPESAPPAQPAPPAGEQPAQPPHTQPYL